MRSSPAPAEEQQTQLSAELLALYEATKAVAPHEPTVRDDSLSSQDIPIILHDSTSSNTSRNQSTSSETSIFTQSTHTSYTPSFSPPISPRTLRPPSAYANNDVTPAEALKISSANALILSPETSPLLSDSASESSTHCFEMAQTAEILCMLADTDLPESHIFPQSDEDINSFVCTEQYCKDYEGGCIHQFPLGGFAPAIITELPENSQQQQQAYQLAPWAIYTNYGAHASQPQPSHQQLEESSSQDFPPPLTHEEWSALTSPVESLPWDASINLNLQEPDLIAPDNDITPLQLDSEHIFPDHHYSTVPSYDTDDDSRYISSPLVEDFLTTCLPPDTPADEWREWYNFLSASNEDKSCWPRFLGEAQPQESIDEVAPEEEAGGGWDNVAFEGQQYAAASR